MIHKTTIQFRHFYAMKQFKLSIIITVLMSMTGLQAFADWDTATKIQVDGLYYYLDEANQQAQVTMSSGKYTGDIMIPTTFTYNETNYSVTSIGKEAFSGCSALTSVTIGNSVTSIGERAFYDCHKLTSITIGNSVTSIGSDAFNNTAWYNNQPDGLVYAGKVAYKYKGTKSAYTVISILEGTLGIAGSAFQYCANLTGVIIPNSVTSIGSDAFFDCANLTGVTIPNSVTSIGERAFSGCSGLTSIIVASGNTKYDSRNNCNAIIETASNTLLYGCKKTTIPNSVTSIGGGAFCNCSGLTSVTIPSSVTSIGESAFRGCSSLTSVTIPNSVMNIGSGAFSFCSGLTSITIGNSVTSIGELAFEGCTSLTSVTIPSSVTSIGVFAFTGCSGLTSVTIPNSVTSIGDYAFSGSKLTSVTIPNSVTSIGDRAFFGSKLTSVTALNPTPIAITEEVFTNRTNATLYVSKGSKSAYQAAANWNEFKEIIELEATGIKTIDLSLTPDSSPKDEGSEYWYDLQGHRIVNPSNGQLPKGIYIHQGKKIVVK